MQESRLVPLVGLLLLAGCGNDETEVDPVVDATSVLDAEQIGPAEVSQLQYPAADLDYPINKISEE